MKKVNSKPSTILNIVFLLCLVTLFSFFGSEAIQIMNFQKEAIGILQQTNSEISIEKEEVENKLEFTVFQRDSLESENLEKRNTISSLSNSVKNLKKTVKKQLERIHILKNRKVIWMMEIERLAQKASDLADSNRSLKNQFKNFENRYLEKFTSQVFLYLSLLPSEQGQKYTTKFVQKYKSIRKSIVGNDRLIYSNKTLKRVSEQTGISAAALYVHFGKKGSKHTLESLNKKNVKSFLNLNLLQVLEFLPLFFEKDEVNFIAPAITDRVNNM